MWQQLIEKHNRLEEIHSKLSMTSQMIYDLKRQFLLEDRFGQHVELERALQRHPVLLVFWRLFSLGALVWTHSLLSPCLVPGLSSPKSGYKVIVVVPLLKHLGWIWSTVTGRNLFPDCDELVKAFASLPPSVCRPCESKEIKELVPCIPIAVQAVQSMWYWESSSVEAAIKIAVQCCSQDLTHEALLPYKCHLYQSWLLSHCTDKPSLRLVKMAHNGPWNELGSIVSSEEWQQLFQLGFEGLSLMWQRCHLLARSAPQVLKIDPQIQPLFPFWANTTWMPHSDLPYAFWLQKLPSGQKGTQFAPWIDVWGEWAKPSKPFLCVYDKHNTELTTPEGRGRLRDLLEKRRHYLQECLDGKSQQRKKKRKKRKRES